jgi:hypothetical protein
MSARFTKVARLNNAALSGVSIDATGSASSEAQPRTSNSPHLHRPKCTPVQLRARVKALRRKVDYYATHVNGHLAIEQITLDIARLETELANA